MTASDLELLLIAHLVRQKGGTSQSWRRALAKIKVRDASTHSHFNWEVTPCGTALQRAAIEELLDDVRLQHSIITVG
jgi:hypothetical protein